VDGLRSLADRCEPFGDIRGSGLFVAVELVTDRDSRRPATEFTARLVNELRHQGVLTGSIGPDANILKLRSPMVLSNGDVDFMLEILERSMNVCVS
jgi:4-aminobutyrate aminotransferase-like enzyme